MTRQRKMPSINSLEIFTEKEINAEGNSGSMKCIPNMQSPEYRAVGFCLQPLVLLS